MVKICLVKSCPSGRKMKSNRSGTPQSLSYFQATTPAKLENWKKSLGIDLKPVDYLCHLHFKEEHIKMYEKIYINGEQLLFPIGKKMLKEEAIPTIEHQYVPIPENELQGSLIDPLRKQSSSSIQRKDKKHAKDVKKIPKNIKKIFKDVNKLPRKPNAKKNTATQGLNQSINKSADNILNNINLSLLPPLWVYFKMADEVEFMRMDTNNKKIINHIRLNKDLSISVIFPNNDELRLNDKISSLPEVTDYLKCVEKWSICVGTQMDGSNRFAKLCKGVIIGEDIYKRNRQYPRCRPCRILRNRIQKRHSKSANLLKKNAQNHSGNLIKQCKRSKRKLKNAKDVGATSDIGT